MFKQQTTVTPEYLLEKLQLCVLNSGRTVETASMKLTEEVGEVMEAVFSTSLLNKEKRYKNIPDAAVVEECIDVILCAISVIRLKKPYITIDHVLKIANAKLDKWIKTQNWIMPEPYGIDDIPDHDETPTEKTDTPDSDMWHLVTRRDEQGNIFLDAQTTSANFDSMTQQAHARSLSLRSLIEEGQRTLDKHLTDEICGIPDGAPASVIFWKIDGGLSWDHLHTWVRDVKCPADTDSTEDRNSLLHAFLKTTEFDKVEQPTDTPVRSTDNVCHNKDYPRAFATIYKWATTEIKKLNNSISECPKLKNKYCRHSDTCEQYNEYVCGVFTLLMKVHTAMSVVYTKYNTPLLNPCDARKEIAFLISVCINYPRYLDVHHAWWNLHGVKFAHDKNFPFGFVPFVDEYYSNNSEE